MAFKSGWLASTNESAYSFSLPASPGKLKAPIVWVNIFRVLAALKDKPDVVEMEKHDAAILSFDPGTIDRFRLSPNKLLMLSMSSIALTFSHD